MLSLKANQKLLMEEVMKLFEKNVLDDYKDSVRYGETKYDKAQGRVEKWKITAINIGLQPVIPKI
jgi:hypothetical protein